MWNYLGPVRRLFRLDSADLVVTSRCFRAAETSISHRQLLQMVPHNSHFNEYFIYSSLKNIIISTELGVNKDSSSMIHCIFIQKLVPRNLISLTLK